MKLFSVLVLALVLSGCESAARQVASWYGFKGDPMPGHCAPQASVAAGKCVAQRGGK